MKLIKPAYRPDQLRYMGIIDDRNRLRPLVWICSTSPFHNGEYYYAKTNLVDYEVSRLIDGDWNGSVSGCPDGPSFGTFRTPELAKAACERHYKRYIHKLQHPTILDWLADLF